MKSFKLDDIEKKGQPFSVPEGYFENLPMQIQSRIQEEKKQVWVKTPAFRLAFSAAAVLTIIFTLVFTDRTQTAEEILAGISEEELIAYVDFTQIDESEIYAALQDDLNDIDFSDSELEDLELEDEALDDLLNEYDLSDDFL